MSNNPFNVPVSPPALIDPPQSRAKQVLHVLAFAMILAVWYWSVIFEPTEAAEILTALHSIVVIMLFHADKLNQGAPLSDFRLIFYMSESIFLILLGIAAWHRSFKLTLALLAIVFLWSLINFAVIFIANT